MRTRFYIQDAGRPVGNCVRWWRDGGHGYTCNLKEAWKVTESEGRPLLRPGEDVMHPCHLIDAVAQLHVDTQTMPVPEKKLVKNAL